MGKNREELNEEAKAAGIEDPESLDTKADVIAAIQAATGQGEQPFGVLLQVQEDGTYAATPMGGMGPMAIPVHLRRAANELEAALTKAGG